MKHQRDIQYPVKQGTVHPFDVSYSALLQGEYNRWTGPLDWATGLDYWTHLSPQKCIVPRLLESGNHPNFVKVSPRQSHPPG